MVLDPRELRNGFGRFATGVTVVTCANDLGQPRGATVNAFTAVSLDPALCQVTLTRRSRTCTYLDGAPFVVNVLAADQLGTALHFAGRPQKPEPEWAQGTTAPILVGCAATISCRPWRTYDGGDHLIVIGEVDDLEITDAEPLLFFAGQFRELAARPTGVHWNGSIDCPESGWFDATTVFTPLRAHQPAAS
ncbi:flavin reductase domain protein FMN-binding protein [Pseudonocardia dioxanivorans CB1190]|uniref:Flavin reductase domain protein FMN-binding protein n=1 Tax=Pseudonocardia dioxanivorans (strain ATCC 55486 / DSM 44775 / JCM 13855 / CB1190) TaxID=675635 RepID=F4CK70_PSEUX|nr:flavin reductase family protein [Pseudonocardia dioxanivorans]AEA28176.1 flavin reductase domain protein FMN-binding protein [Pseudonocardia dioxanivorans CB1190]